MSEPNSHVPDEARPDQVEGDLPTEKHDDTITEPVTGPDTAPSEGLERGDAQQSGPLHSDDIEVLSDDSEHIGRGSWRQGDALEATSGYNPTNQPPPQPGFAEPPFGGWFDEVANRMLALVPGAFTKVALHRGEITFHVPRERIKALVRALRDDAALRFEVCPSVSGVHYPEQTGEELHVVYHLTSITHNRRIRLEVAVSDADPHLPSVVDTYPMTNYHERETWDMFGIIFDGHPALTRILMPDDWVGHPQRKDYPLGGIPVEFKGAVVPPPDQRRRFH